MRSIEIRTSRLAKMALGLLALSLVSAPAQAHSFLFAGPSLMILLGSGSHCVAFAYDANGNRISQAVGTIGSGPMLWGSGTFGCFVWDQ